MLGFCQGRQARALQAELDAIHRSQAVIEFSPDGTILTANAAFLAATGYALADIAGKHHGLFMPPEDRAGAAYAEFWAALRRGEFRAGVFRRVARDGREIWLQASYSPVAGPDGQPVKVVKLAADVTQARMEAAAARGQVQAIRRSQAVVEFSPDGIVQDANETFLQTMGYRLEEVRGQHHAIFMPAGEGRGPAYAAFWAALARGEYRTGEFKRLAKGDREVWLQASYNPILNDEGQVMRVVKFGSDVTAARLELASTRGQVQAIHRAQAVIEFDLDGTILTANDNFLRATGYSLADIVGKHHAIFMPPDERDAPEYRSFWTSLRGGEFRQGEFRRVRRGGRELFLHATYNPILDMEGRPIKVVKFATDITAQVEERRQYVEMVENVAAASHELSASISEIALTMTRSQAQADQAVRKVMDAEESTSRLNAAAQSIGRVVEMISGITSRINLLALNATIESARAGEAGRGFAVVANEVKELAHQAKTATQEIVTEVTGIRGVAGDVVAALGSIRHAIDSVSEFVVSTSAAVEEQSAATGTISATMQSAAARSARAA